MVVVVLDDVFDPLVAVQITSTLRFWLMTGSSLGNVDLGEILFTLQRIDEFAEVWVICCYIGLKTAMPAFDCIVFVLGRSSRVWLYIFQSPREQVFSHRSDSGIRIFNPMVFEDTVVSTSMEDFNTISML